jgi:hypothetical protein
MNMKKITPLLIAFSLVFGFFIAEPIFTKAMADDAAPATTSEGEGGMCGRKDVKCASDPSKCGSVPDANKIMVTPPNCLFLEEPIGGEPYYDLYLVTCQENPVSNKMDCTTALWNGGAIPPNTSLKQALLTEDPSKPYQGPFGLLYSYIQLIYAYMSGIIVGVSVLFVVVGGVQMSISNGDETKFTAGKSRITKAVVGIIIWFTASLILYTINPTFFAF